MTFSKKLFAVGVLTVFPVVSHAQVGPAAPACQAIQFNVNAVALPAPKVLNPVVDFSGSGGQLDPTPLLQTTINVLPGRPTCVVVHFSTQADPQDNAIVFQASIDNVPMLGHGTACRMPHRWFPIRKKRISTFPEYCPTHSSLRSRRACTSCASA
jgi:hypothetical protein